MPLLEIQNITASVAASGDSSHGDGSKTVLHDLSLDVEAATTHVIMGPNGAGKSTLGNVLMGSPVYRIDSGRIIFDGTDITEEKADARARAGMFMSFQSPIEIPGLSLESFIRAAMQQRGGQKVKLFQFQKALKAACASVHLDESYMGRDLNVGFSGGERKKAEILQLIMLRPRLAILDETDSGLDVDAVREVGEAIGKWQVESGGSAIVITHSTRILEKLHVDTVHILQAGTIVRTGGAEMIAQINERGFVNG